MNNQVRVGLAAILSKEDKILLGLRKGAHDAGTWQFPGGHLEFEESFEECARREVREETGLEVGNVRFATATNDIFRKDGKHYVTVFMDCEYQGGEPEIMEPEKCERWEWFSKYSLPSNLMTGINNLVEGGYKF